MTDNHNKSADMTNPIPAHAPLALSFDTAVFDTGSWVGRVWLPEQGPAVVLVSGGLDSATCLAIARGEGFACHALSFAYGQRHEAELAAARLAPNCR